MRVDRADFVQLDDVQLRAGGRGLVAVGAVGVGWRRAGRSSTVSLPPAAFSWAATKSSSSLAGGEPFFAAAEIDVVDGQPAVSGSCRTAWIWRLMPRRSRAMSDSSMRGQRADEPGHLLAFDRCGRRPASNTASARPSSSSWAFISSSVCT